MAEKRTSAVVDEARPSLDSIISMVDVDRMLSFVGDFNRYQYVIISLFSIINVLSALQYFGQTFTSLEPIQDVVNRTENDTICHTPRYNSSSEDLLFGYVSIVKDVSRNCMLETS